jgi:hypothetical protein
MLVFLCALILKVLNSGMNWQTFWGPSNVRQSTTVIPTSKYTEEQIVSIYSRIFKAATGGTCPSG